MCGFIVHTSALLYVPFTITVFTWLIAAVTISHLHKIIAATIQGGYIATIQGRCLLQHNNDRCSYGTSSLMLCKVVLLFVVI